jgi:hypothetical protein
VNNEFGKNLEGSGRGLILRYYNRGIRLEGLKKTTKTSVTVSGPRFGPRIFQLRGRSVNALNMTLGDIHVLEFTCYVAFNVTL